MPALIITVLRKWVIAAVALPLAAGGARRLTRSIETHRGGSSAVTRGLTKAAGTLERSKSKASNDSRGDSGRRHSGRGQ